MNQPHVEVDRLVREAIRELRAAPPSPSHNGAAVQRASDSHRPGVHWVGERIVSLASLNGQMKSIQTLAVRADAIITPALRDELASRGIALERRAEPSMNGQSTSPAPGLVWLASADSPLVAADLAKALLQSGCAAQVLDAAAENGSNLERLLSAIEALSKKLESGGAGVLLTDRPAAALCLANRRPAVRAALAHSYAAVEEAASQLGANLLVIAARDHSRHQLKRLAIGFARASQKTCPPELAAALGKS
jgi:hypothetical protein